MKFKKTIIAPLIVASIVVTNFGSAFARIRGASPNEISEFKILEVTSEPTDTDSQKDLEIIFKSEGTTKNSSPNLPQTVQISVPKTTIPSSPNKNEGISNITYGLNNVVTTVVHHPFNTIFVSWGVGLLARLLTGIPIGCGFKIGFILTLAGSYLEGHLTGSDAS